MVKTLDNARVPLIGCFSQNLPVKRNSIMKKIPGINRVLIIGFGPIIIVRACEFDYFEPRHASLKMGYEIILVNSNPATIMTDPGMADATCGATDG